MMRTQTQTSDEQYCEIVRRLASDETVALSEQMEVCFSIGKEKAELDAAAKTLHEQLLTTKALIAVDHLEAVESARKEVFAAKEKLALAASVVDEARQAASVAADEEEAANAAFQRVARAREDAKHQARRLLPMLRSAGCDDVAEALELASASWQQ